MGKGVPNHLIDESLLEYDKLITRLTCENDTPFYLYDCKMLKKSFERLKGFLPKKVKIFYSLKANPNCEVISFLAKMGSFFETCSMGEMKKVYEITGSLNHTIFIGVGKKINELEYAIEKQIRYIVIESMEESKKIQNVCEKLGRKVCIAFRINPGSGHGIMSMGGATQFGMDEATAISIFKEKEKFPMLEFKGFHSYIGTGNLNNFSVLENTEKIIEALNSFVEKTGFNCTFLDIGGGFGIPYTRNDEPIDLHSIKTEFNDLIDSCMKMHPNLEEIAVESGRFLVGTSGIFVTTVLDVKQTFGDKYVIVDGGLNNFNNIMSKNGFTPTPMRLITDSPRERGIVSICGPLCTPADKFAYSVEFEIPEIGDLVVFYHSGAYAFSASPVLFLGHPIAKEFLISGNKSLEDLI